MSGEIFEAHDASAHVVWGFDAGDSFTVFPLLPLLPGESQVERWKRSFIPARDAGEMLCIESEVVDILLRDILIGRFDVGLDQGRDEFLSDLPVRFDWYMDNVYTVRACAEICDLLEDAVGTLGELPDDTFVRLDSDGHPSVALRPGDCGGRLSMPASVAERDCSQIAGFLRRIMASAETAGATISFSGP